jgi:hypothetical protein
VIRRAGRAGFAARAPELQMHQPVSERAADMAAEPGGTRCSTS